MSTQPIERPPRILFDPGIKLALLWSAKSASTFAVKWFFKQAGLLEEALAYHPWIHNYRMQVYYHSDSYRQDLAKVNNDRYRVVKFVRNPYYRAVSSYIHAVKHGQADKKLNKFLGRSQNSQRNFSFREFVDYLGSIDVSRCNIHYQRQVHACEAEGVLYADYILQVEKAKHTLGIIERELGLQTTNVAELNPSKHHTKRYHSTESFGDVKLEIVDKRKATYPETASFYDDDLILRISRIYSLDFDMYEYPKEFPAPNK